MNGYSQSTVTEQGGFFSGAQSLAKPFSPETLARTIRQLLDS